MVKSVVNGVTTYYPGRHYNKEVNGTTERTQKFYQAAGQTIAVRTNGDLKWILSDHLGSTSVTANANGTWNSELRYTPYGETRYNSGLTPSDYRYTGQLQQAELGLYYYVARWYDPRQDASPAGTRGRGMRTRPCRTMRGSMGTRIH